MPLNTTLLHDTLQAAFLSNLPDTPSDEQKDQVDNLSTAIANAMKAFVQGATITYTAGLVAPPGGGPVTGVFTNTIS